MAQWLCEGIRSLRSAPGAEMKTLRSRTKMIDARGAIVMPGLITATRILR